MCCLSVDSAATSPICSSYCPATFPAGEYLCIEKGDILDVRTESAEIDERFKGTTNFLPSMGDA